MKFLDKVKSMKNSITGWAAKVFVNAQIYQAYTELDCFGNDSDSGWIKRNLD